MQMKKSLPFPEVFDGEHDMREDIKVLNKLGPKIFAVHID